MKKTSNLITWINTIMTIAIVWLHADCSYMLQNDDYMMRWFYRSVNALYDMAVPCFFVISAFLFYTNITEIKQQYKEKMCKRVFSLLIPYFIFSFLWMLVYSVFSLVPKVGAFVPDSMFKYNLSENILHFMTGEYNPPMWYVRTLFVLQLISPLFYVFIKKEFWIAPLSAIGMILINCYISPGYSTTLFWIPIFIVGIWYAIYYERVNLLVEKIKTWWLWIAWIILYVISVLSSQSGLDNIPYYCYRIIGAILLVIILARITKFTSSSCVLAQYTFFVFMVHYPVVQMLKRILALVIDNNLLIYVLSAFITSVTCFLCAYIIKKYIPFIWKILNGNR